MTLNLTKMPINNQCFRVITALILGGLSVALSLPRAEALPDRPDIQSFKSFQDKNLSGNGMGQVNSVSQLQSLKSFQDTNLSGNGMGQINSVSQLRDIAPTDWAYEALKSLVERYGCIVGYPDSTFRGNRALSRYEFAAGLNACLSTMERLLQENVAVLREDIDKLKRLAMEFEAELGAMTAKVENLENRVSYLEDHQFSTTTKLNGVVSLNLVSPFSGSNGTQTTLQQATYLGLTTSFTGRDLLSTAFYSSTTNIPDYTAVNDDRDYGPIGSTREGLTTWAYGGSTGGALYLLSAEYIFPVIDTIDEKLYVTIAAINGFNTSKYILPGKGLSWEGLDLGNGPISAFGQRNPMYRLGGGQGAIANYDNGDWRLSLGYLAAQGSSPGQGQGLFNGDYLALGQLNYSPSDDFSIAFAYRNNYFGPGRFAFNNQYSYGPDSPGFVGTGLANTFDNQGVFLDHDVPVVSNTYGLQAFYRVSPGFVVGGFGAKINPILIGQGNADIWTYSLNFAFPDLGKEGNLGGLIVGVEPTLTGLRIGGQNVTSFANDTSLHIEAFYRYQVNNNISVTPGVMWITAPNQDAKNSDIIVGVLRTTFSF